MDIRGIAISGKAAAGKDTIANALFDEFFVRGRLTWLEKLAFPIYEEAYRDFSMDPGKKDRPLLQRIGDAHTQAEPTYYARLLVERVRANNRTQYGDIPIVTDMRKVIEAEYLRQCGFVLIRLDVTPQVQKSRIEERDGWAAYDPFVLSHWTETDLDHYTQWTFRFPNNGTSTPKDIAKLIAGALYDE